MDDFSKVYRVDIAASVDATYTLRVKRGQLIISKDSGAPDLNVEVVDLAAVVTDDDDASDDFNEVNRLVDRFVAHDPDTDVPRIVDLARVYEYEVFPQRRGDKPNIHIQCEGPWRAAKFYLNSRGLYTIAKTFLDFAETLPGAERTRDRQGRVNFDDPQEIEEVFKLAKAWALDES